MQAGDRWKRGTRAGGDQAAVERDHALGTVAELYLQGVPVTEAGFAAQHGNGRGAVQNPLVLGLAQFIDARLLLRQQTLAQDRRRGGGNTAIERTFRRRCAMCAARIMILDGTQPTLTQVPPRVPRSISVTRAPCSTAFKAAAMAAPPLPITATWSAGPAPARAGFVSSLNQSRARSDRPRGASCASAACAW